MRSNLLGVCFFAVASIAACSGNSGTGIADADGGAENDAATIDGSVPGTPDGGPVVDGGGTDGGGGVDSGLVVTEQPAPTCHDLAQAAPSVKTTGNPDAAPTPSPITTIAPGLYVAKSIVDYGGTSPLQDGATRTTVFFTATKQYYVRDDASAGHQVLTLDWKIQNGKLLRNVLCSGAPSTSTITYRVGASANGYLVLIDGLQPGNRTQVVTYERVP
jgi:hypothetical protein